ncbi:MAG: putative sulfate exporter family transporter [Myxococcota bacterium]|nr:putative sulfate exporter family transporter [Myxococcota bacterium]
MPISASAPQRGNPYENPELLRWLDSYEGLPDIADPGESAAEQRSRAGARAYELFGLAGAVLPGVALAAGIAAVAGAAADGIGRGLFGFERSPIPGVALAILLGLAIRNVLGLPIVYDAGLRLCVKRLLRVGVALLGIRLSLAAAGAIGVAALPIVVGAIAVALFVVTGLGRLLGLPSRLSLLIAVGTGICGNTAILATGPVIDADEDEMSYAVACVTIFGLLALLLYPPLAHLLFAGDASRIGLFLGTAIHDTAQVAGAALLYAQHYGAPEALDVATVTKLVRNLFLLAVIPLIALLHRRQRPGA